MKGEREGAHESRVPSFKRRVKHHSRMISAFLGTQKDVVHQASLAISTFEGSPGRGGSVGALRARTKL